MTTPATTPAWAHPNPDMKLFGFRLNYATGQTDYGLVVASSKEVALQMIDPLSFCSVGYELIVNDQPAFVQAIVDQYRGVAFLTTEPSCP